jgi:hypothetical protein
MIFLERVYYLYLTRVIDRCLTLVGDKPYCLGYFCFVCSRYMCDPTVPSTAEGGSVGRCLTLSSLMLVWPEIEIALRSRRFPGILARLWGCVCIELRLRVLSL